MICSTNTEEVSPTAGSRLKKLCQSSIAQKLQHIPEGSP